MVYLRKEHGTTEDKWDGKEVCRANKVSLQRSGGLRTIIVCK